MEKDKKFKKAYCSWNDFIGSHDVQPHQGRSVGKWMVKEKKLKKDWIVKIVKGIRLRRVMWWLAFSCVWVAGECQWLHLELIKEMRNFCKTLFPVVEYAYGTIPTYPSGQIGFMLCSKDPVSVSSLGSCQSQQRCQIVWKEPALCWFAIEIGETFLPL